MDHHRQAVGGDIAPIQYVFEIREDGVLPSDESWAWPLCDHSIGNVDIAE